MIQIRPVSDLSNNFSEIEKAVEGGQPVYLTKDGYGSMVVMSLGMYYERDYGYDYDYDLEHILDEADQAAAATDVRYTHEEVFGRLREGLNG